MRSKEVEKAIDVLNKGVYNANLFGSSSMITLTPKVLQITLNYISELEEKVNTIDTQFIHKDKVFEIVELMNKHIDIYNDTVDKFNKLLEVK